MSKDKAKDRKGAFFAGTIMVGIGLVFLLSNMGIIPDLSETWPLLLIVVGAAMLFGALRDRGAQSEMPAPPNADPPMPHSVE